MQEDCKNCISKCEEFIESFLRRQDFCMKVWIDKNVSVAFPHILNINK